RHPVSVKAIRTKQKEVWVEEITSGGFFQRKRVKEREGRRVGGRECGEVEEGRREWGGGCESWEVGVEWGSEKIAKRVKKQRNLERRERR
ncbi:419_t:CDS:2, partial [Dentiscutata erythropus]